MIVVFDKGGLEGWLAEENELSEQPQALALLSDGRQVHIPVALLQPRSASAYDLPVHFSDLERENAADAQDGVAVPLHEETLEIGKRRIETPVRIEKTVNERQEVLERPTVREEVQIERVRVDRPVDGPVAVRHEGDTVVIPLLEEEVVTQKRLVLREEIRITKRQTREDRTETVVLRSEEAVISRIEPSDSKKEEG
jgi:uncharacterized protein (TIGR02271 family)